MCFVCAQSLHRQSLAAYHKHIGVSTATTTLWPVLEEQESGDRQARGELGLALSVWDACCDHAVRRSKMNSFGQ